MATCKIYGTIVNSDGTASEGTMVHAVPVTIPTIVGGSAITPYPVEAITTSTGYFELNLLQQVDFRVIINTIGFRQVVKVPAAVDAVLWTLSAVQETGGTADNTNW